MTETGVGVTGEVKTQEAASESDEVRIVTETVNKKFLTFGVRENPPFHISFIYAIQVRFQHFFFFFFRGLPFSTYAPRRVGGVNPPIHFHCVLHAKRGWVGPDSM